MHWNPVDNVYKVPFKTPRNPKAEFQTGNSERKTFITVLVLSVIETDITINRSNLGKMGLTECTQFFSTVALFAESGFFQGSAIKI